MGHKSVSQKRRKLSSLFWNLKIQSKQIICFSAAFVISIVTVISVYYLSWKNSLRQEAVNYSSLYLNQLNDNIDAYFSDLDRLLLMTQADSRLQEILGTDLGGKSDIELRDNSDYVENFLFNIYTIKPDITNIVLISENGMLITEGIRRYSLFNENPVAYRWYREASRNPGKSMIVKNMAGEDPFGQNGSESTISVVRKITDNGTGRILGCIRADVTCKKVQSNIELVGRNSSMEILVMDKDYNMIFDPNSLLKSVSIPRFADAFETILAGKEGSLRTNLGKTDRTVVYNSSDYTGWFALGIILEDKLMKDTRDVRDLSFLIAAITIIAIVSICVFISLGITKPLRKLRNSMQLVAGGDFDARVDFDYKDEIGDIGRSFDKMTFKIKELIQKEYLLEIKRKEAELKALQAQINPHFLYNTLESLRMKAVVNNDGEVAEMTKKLSKFLHLNIIRDSEIVRIREELEHVGYYIDIQNVRYNNRFEYIADFDEDLLDACILKLTLQPLIENAIFHGLEPKEGYCAIILRGRREGGDILIEVVDNGMGIDQDRLNEIRAALESSRASGRLGIGIVNVHKRLKFHFGDSYGIEISSTVNKGTRIAIRIPYRTFSQGGEDDAQTFAG